MGAGKSEILTFIKKHYKCRVYLADEVAHLVKKKGQHCYRQLVELLGEEILEPCGEIDKKKMAAVIFGNEELLAQVNAIVHPQVRVYLEERIKEAAFDEDVELLFIEAALLIEAGYQEIVDELWYVYANRQVRKDRLRIHRGYSDEKIEQIMSSQLTDEEFRSSCDFCIDNSGELTKSYKQIMEKLEAFTWLE